jgi:hypothetical protein
MLPAKKSSSILLFFCTCCAKSGGAPRGGRIKYLRLYTELGMASDICFCYDKHNIYEEQG